MHDQVALFDLDKTLYDGFSLLDVIDAQVKAKLISQQVADSFRRSITDHEDGKIGYEDMAQYQLELYAEALKDKEYETAFRSALAHFRQSRHFFAYAGPVIDLLDETHKIVLITALPEPAAKAAAAAVGALDTYSSTYELEHGRFTGAVGRSLTARQGKRACVEDIQKNYSMKNSFAFGDSEGDTEMLRAVDYAICVNPSDGLRREAERHGWYTTSPADIESLVRRLLSQQR